MRVRDAVPEDAAAACEVMRRSIAELCVADHHNDPGILERWLGNKTPEIFKSWIQPGNSVLVAVENGTVRRIGKLFETPSCFLDFLFRNALGPRPGFDRCLAVLGDGLPDHPARNGISGMRNQHRCNQGTDTDHLPSMTLMPSHTAPTNPATMIVITALNV
jgi:hypothetical protein